MLWRKTAWALEVLTAGHDGDFLGVDVHHKAGCHRNAHLSTPEFFCGQVGCHHFQRHGGSVLPTVHQMQCRALHGMGETFDAFPLDPVLLQQVHSLAEGYPPRNNCRRYNMQDMKV